MTHSTSSLLVLGAIVVAPLSFCAAVPIGINELKAISWGYEYGRITHPAGTERILLHQGTTKVSNGDNCDFFVFEARTYAAGSEQAITDHYAQQDNPIDWRSSPLRPEFFTHPPSTPGPEPYDAFERHLALVQRGSYYMLQAWAVVESAPPLVDWRCL